MSPRTSLVIFFWSLGIMDCMLFTFENRVPLMHYGRQWSGIFHWGLLKPGIGWDWPGSAGTRSRGLAFGTFGSRVPGFDIIAITDLICFSPLAMNDRERMYSGLAGLIDLIQSIDQIFIFCIVKFYFIKMKYGITNI